MNEEDLITNPPEGDPPVTPESVPATPPPAAVVPPQTPPRDYETELALKDQEILRITTEWQTAKNDTHMSKAENTKAQVALAKAIAERESLATKAEQQLNEVKTNLDTVSQATQTLNEERTSLTSELETQAAKATKLEVLTEEFPELLRYSKLIPASRDADEVRAACTALRDARTADLEAQRVTAITGNGATQLPGSPTRTDQVLQTPEEIRNYLDEARNNPSEYERRRQALLSQFEAAKARAGFN